ncbi:MAG: hypothetical protein K2Y37_14590 [Pirellulales bacterium]|nr:hypothetical protein [Pirellulales bacterium]
MLAVAPLALFALSTADLPIDPLRLAVALGPVVTYLLAIGRLNLGRRPQLVTGVRDTTALCIALAGMAIVGPIELFFPMEAAANFGAYVTWALCIALYALLASFLVFSERPRLVVYNATFGLVREVLEGLTTSLDEHAQWAGHTLALPTLGVELHLGTSPGMRCVTLTAANERQSLAGWRRLEAALRAALAEIEVDRNPLGLSMAVIGVLVGVAVLLMLAGNPEAVARALREMMLL